VSRVTIAPEITGSFIAPRHLCPRPEKRISLNTKLALRRTSLHQICILAYLIGVRTTKASSLRVSEILSLIKFLRKRNFGFQGLELITCLN